MIPSYWIIPCLVNKKQITIDYIKKKVCNYFNIDINDLNLKSRKREIVQARQIAHYISAKFTDDTYTKIGIHIGSKDHATVTHSIKTINNLISIDKKFANLISEIICTI